MSGPYTLTVHIAQGGTPTFNPEMQAWEKAKNTSSAGHMWYSIRDESLPDGHQEKEKSYGFAPEDGKSGIKSVTGEVSPDDNKIYHQPRYGRTLEISEEQYQRLNEFGQNGMDKKWDYFNPQYHTLGSSCVNFTWEALRHAGFEHHVPTPVNEADTFIAIPDYRGPIRPGFKPDLLPYNNLDEVDRMIAPIPDSPYNQTRHGPPAKEVAAGLRKERGAAFRADPQAALEQFPEYTPLRAAKETLDAVSEKYAGSRRGDMLVRKMHHDLANRLERGAAIPNPQQAFQMILNHTQGRGHGD